MSSLFAFWDRYRSREISRIALSWEMADSILIGHFTNRAIQESYNHARYERERGLEKK